MGIIAWIILGLAAGIIAKALVPGKDPGGIIVTTLIGIGGALLGGYLAVRVFDVDGTQGTVNLSAWVCAIVGSTLLLSGYALISGQRGHRNEGRSGARRAPRTLRRRGARR